MPTDLPLPDDPVETEAEAAAAAAANANTRRAMLAASVITVFGIFGSRVLGLTRVQLISAFFGAQDAGALRAAFDLPDLLFYLVAGGAIRSGFVPVFTDLLTQGRDDEETRRRAWFLFSVLATGIVVAGTLLVVAGEIWTKQLTAPMTGGWSARGFTAEATELTIRLTRVMLPAQVFMLVGGLLSGALNSVKHFTVPALVPAFYNLAIIGAMVFFGRRLGVTSAAWGVLVGGFFGHLLWQAWAMRKYGEPHGMFYRPSLAFTDPEVIRVLKIAAPIMLGLCVAEINLKISGWVIAWFGEAARAWFDNASRIARLPDGIFGAGLGIALFPFLSELASEGKQTEFLRQTEMTLRLALVCVLPCVAIMIAVPQPIIAALFGYGQFHGADVNATARLLPLFALGIVPVTLQVVITRAFYAQQDSLTPLKIGAVTVAFGIAINLLLGKLLGVPGPALALSITSTLNVVGLMWLFSRKFGYHDPGRLWRVLGRSSVATVACGLAGWASAAALGQFSSHALLVVPVSAAVSFGVYLLGMKWLGVEDLDEAGRILRRRFRRRERR